MEIKAHLFLPMETNTDYNLSCAYVGGLDNPWDSIQFKLNIVTFY